jgi:hypothetical protein
MYKVRAGWPLGPCALPFLVSVCSQAQSRACRVYERRTCTWCDLSDAVPTAGDVSHFRRKPTLVAVTWLHRTKTEATLADCLMKYRLLMPQYTAPKHHHVNTTPSRMQTRPDTVAESYHNGCAGAAAHD